MKSHTRIGRDEHERPSEGISESNLLRERADVEVRDGRRRRHSRLVVEPSRLAEQQEYVSVTTDQQPIADTSGEIETYRCASDPAGGVGCRNPDTGGVLLTSERVPPPVDWPIVKSPPRKCRICAEVGVCGVGASGSTAATTNFCPRGALVRPRTAKVGGPTVAKKKPLP